MLFSVWIAAVATLPRNDDGVKAVHALPSLGGRAQRGEKRRGHTPSNSPKCTKENPKLPSESSLTKENYYVLYYHISYAFCKRFFTLFSISFIRSTIYRKKLQKDIRILIYRYPVSTPGRRHYTIMRHKI